jgi:hypothetical protein
MNGSVGKCGAGQVPFVELDTHTVRVRVSVAPPLYRQKKAPCLGGFFDNFAVEIDTMISIANQLISFNITPPSSDTSPFPESAVRSACAELAHRSFGGVLVLGG